MTERRGQEEAPKVQRPERPATPPAAPPPTGGGGGRTPPPEQFDLSPVQPPGCVGSPEGPRLPGEIEQAVEADLEGVKLTRGKFALAAACRKLARVIDARGDEEPASQTAKAVETLRITMNQIMARESNDPTLVQSLLAGLSTPSDGGSSLSPPFRYPPES